jgi:hypothetical protein
MTFDIRKRALALSLGLAAFALPAIADEAPAEGAAPAASAPAANPGGPQPKAVIEELTFNAGDIPKGTTIDHEFVVKNAGKADLMILAVKPACGCTAPDWTKIVAAGGTGKISLKIDTTRFKGPISKTATVTTNDPENSNFRLTVNANISTFVDVLPSDTVTFRQYRGEQKTEEVTIHSNEKGDFQIKDVQVTGDGIKQTLAKATDGTGDYKLNVSLDPNAPIGTINGEIKLLTNSAKESEIKVQVRGSIMGQITVSPSSLYYRIDSGGGAPAVWLPTSDNLNVRERGEIGAPVVVKLAKDAKLTLTEESGEWAKVRTEGGQEGWVAKKFLKQQAAATNDSAQQSKVLNLTHRLDNANFSVTGTSVEGIKLDPKAIKVSTETVKAGQSYRLTVTYAGGLAKGNYTGTLVIKTSDKDEPAVKVPLYIVVP